MENQSPALHLRTLRILHYGLFAGVLVVSIAAFFFQDIFASDDSTIGTFFMVIVPVWGLGAILVSKRMYSKMLSGIGEDADLNTKLNHYRSASIVRAGLLEGAMIISAIGVLLTAQLWLYIITAILAVVFLGNMPTADRIGEALGLDLSERRALEKRS